VAAARATAGGPPDLEPAPEQIAAAAAGLAAAAIAPFEQLALRSLLLAIHGRDEQVIDQVSIDEIKGLGYSADSTAAALQTVQSFRQFIEEHQDDIIALEILYQQPAGRPARGRVTFEQLTELAARLQLPPHAWSTEALWRAYAQLERDRVRGVGGRRVLADLVSLVRHAVQLDDELVPFPEQVARRYAQWLADQQAANRVFTIEQRWWLDRIATHIGVNLEALPADLDYGEFFTRGGRLAAARELGADWAGLLEELNTRLVVV
jgi:type I restriction enzyme R subunit